MVRTLEDFQKLLATENPSDLEVQLLEDITDTLNALTKTVITQEQLDSAVQAARDETAADWRKRYVARFTDRSEEQETDEETEEDTGSETMSDVITYDDEKKKEDD